MIYKSLSLSALVITVIVAVSAMSTLYPCAGIYCAADGTSFYTFDYSVVKAYNATL